MMKKTLIAMASILAISAWITACGSKNTSFPEPPVTTATEADKEETTSAASETEAAKEETTSTASETEAAKTSGAAKFSTGSWDGYTFTSPWLNLTFTFPEDCIIATEEDIQKVVGDGAELLINNGLSNEAQSKAAEFTTAYDFMVSLPDQASNVQLAHENVSIATLGKGLSAADYMEIIKGQLGAMEDFGYEFFDSETVALGGQEFTKLPVTALGGAMYQDYYFISNGKYISSFIVSYLPDSAELVESIVSGITAAE